MLRIIAECCRVCSRGTETPHPSLSAPRLEPGARKGENAMAPNTPAAFAEELARTVRDMTGLDLDTTPELQAFEQARTAFLTAHPAFTTATIGDPFTRFDEG